jgi:hypothetical protein
MESGLAAEDIGIRRRWCSTVLDLLYSSHAVAHEKESRANL